MPVIDFKKYHNILAGIPTMKVQGNIKEVTGLLIKAVIPGVRIGELCDIHGSNDSHRIRAEVIGFRDDTAYLMPYGGMEGIGLNSRISATNRNVMIKINDSLLGSILNGLGERLTGDGECDDAMMQEYPVNAASPNPLTRKKINRPLPTGVRAIDALLTCGEGQRIGIFSAAGVGKSTLLGMIARDSMADVNIIGLIGERGREVKEFIENDLGPRGLKKSVVIVATSDQPALLRLKAAFVATAVAEYYRDRGKKVMLLMDSITRFARAQREIGLAAGEPPARYGFPPSVFPCLARLLERTGNSEHGSITAFYTILVEADDSNEPVSDEAKAILDGHIVLSRVLAEENHYPAIDILRSVSRVMDNLLPVEHKQAAGSVREVLSTYEKYRDLILIGAYKKGNDPNIDFAIEHIRNVKNFLRQDHNEHSSYASTMEQLHKLFSHVDKECKP
jgi:type III secretion system H+-transporting two-sector ATPase